MPQLDNQLSNLPRLDLLGQLRLGNAVQSLVDRNQYLRDEFKKLAEQGRTSDGESSLKEIEQNQDFIVLALTTVVLSRLRNNQSLGIFRH